MPVLSAALRQRSFLSSSASSTTSSSSIKDAPLSPSTFSSSYPSPSSPCSTTSSGFSHSPTLPLYQDHHHLSSHNAQVDHQLSSAQGPSSSSSSSTSMHSLSSLRHSHHHHNSNPTSHDPSSSSNLNYPHSSPSSPAPHPFGFMASSVSNTLDDEETCPVCLEPLALRLQGEKPHIVPVCGHRLHHECFQQVYGDVNRARIKTSSLGLCGVCRRDMKLGDGGDGPPRKNKFAALSGLPQPSDHATHKMRSLTKGTLDTLEIARHDPTEDDDLVTTVPTNLLAMGHMSNSLQYHEGTSSGTGSTVTGRRSSADTMKAPGSSVLGSGNSRGSHGGGGPFDIVKPIITVRSEHTHVERSNDRDKKQHLTCMVTITMPSRFPTSPPTTETSNSPLLSRREDHSPLMTSNGMTRGGSSDSYSLPPSSNRPSSPAPSSVYSAYAYGSTTSASHAAQNQFATVVEDLQTRMADWKGHQPDEFGQLKLYDWVHVRKETNTREFLVYLFEEAILCVTDDKRKGLGKLADSVAGGQNDKLRLKGRVYVRHIRSAVDTSKGDDLSLTIYMSDDALDEFVMTFKDRSTLDIWRHHIDSLLSGSSPVLPNSISFGSTSSSAPPPAPNSGARSRAMSKSLSNDSFVGSDYSTGSDSARSHGQSSGFSGYTRTTSSTMPLSSSVIYEEDEHHRKSAGGASSSSSSSTYSTYPQHLQHHPSAHLLSSPSLPREFTPLDLMLILSVPSSGPNSLKLGILKSTLDFIIQSVGARTRISIVTFSTGEGSRGVLRKTPFVAVGNPEGRKRLEMVVGELGAESEECQAMIEHKEERVNVVTACNLALDIVLQRKVKSALTGMILMNDGRDGAQKQQMDLVMARAEAANVPIHAVGWGRSHDPSSLWLLSNHTGGSYIFVKEFYDLRDALAGCIGGILSIASTNTRLHISVPEKRWFRIRKVSGTPGAIVSTSGTDVDIDIGELRFGERKDLLVEVEMSFAGSGDAFASRQLREERERERDVAPPAINSATDAYFLKVGLNPASLDDYDPANLYDDEYDSMPDEVPLFEVNAAYRDPAAGKTISRLNHSPCLLTITVMPPSSTNSSDERSTPLSVSAPEIVRRRMELLSSDMLSRALLLMTRRNDSQAKRLLEETKRIISTIDNSLLSGQQPSSSSSPSTSHRTSFTSATQFAHQTLLACAEDVSAVLEGCLQREQFDSHVRYQAAQQAVALRDQRAWTGRTATERLFWSADHSLWLVGRSLNFLPSR